MSVMTSNTPPIRRPGSPSGIRSSSAPPTLGRPLIPEARPLSPASRPPVPRSLRPRTSEDASSLGIDTASEEHGGSEEQTDEEPDLLRQTVEYSRPARFEPRQPWHAINIVSLASDIAVLGVDKAVGLSAFAAGEHVVDHMFALTQSGQAIVRTIQAVQVKRGTTSARSNPLIDAVLPSAPQHWHDLYNAHAANERTIRYVRNRAYKQALSADISAAGNLIAWLATHGLNPLAAPVHLHAATTSAVHWHKIKQIGERHRNTAYHHFSEWCDGILRLKRHKQFTRDGQFLARVIPYVPFVGTAINMVATASSLSFRIAHAEAAGMLSIDLHAHAFQELANGQRGPATEIFEELLTRRGAYRLAGGYDIEGLIAEPAGWQALSNKLIMD
jgi:hypothetical protein